MYLILDYYDDKCFFQIVLIYTLQLYILLVWCTHMTVSKQMLEWYLQFLESTI